jgi:prepilin-type N-terminal cleavage/methylation domain-containing protein
MSNNPIHPGALVTAQPPFSRPRLICANLRKSAVRSSTVSTSSLRGLRAFVVNGFTLPEMLVSLSIIAIVAAVTLPTFYALRDGYTSSGAETIISAALSTARAMAAKEQKYVGVRFQCVPDSEDPTKPGDQYIVFIINDQGLSANGFRAARGVAPIKLPINQGVMDTWVKTTYSPSAGNPQNDKQIAADADIAFTDQLWDTTTFSIVFAPSGRLVSHDVRIWNADGATGATPDYSTDPIFNTYTNVVGAINGTSPVGTPGTATYVSMKGMFYEDTTAITPASPLLKPFPEEPSRKSLVVYDKRILKKTPASTLWTGYLKGLASGDNAQVLFINPYTGTIIENQAQKNALK